MQLLYRSATPPSPRGSPATLDRSVDVLLLRRSGLQTHVEPLIHFICRPTFPPPGLHSTSEALWRLLNYLKHHTVKKESTLSVPWWPAVPSLSHPLPGGPALTGRGAHKSLCLTIHGLGKNANCFLLLLLFYCKLGLFLGWGGGGHQTEMFLYTVFSHLSFSSCATHYQTFPLEEEWVNKCVKKPRSTISESFRVVIVVFFTSAGWGWGGGGM